MRIHLNDEPRDIALGTTVAQLIAQLALPGSRVAVEVNRRLVRRADHEATTLSAEDRVEVVTLVGGG